ncbi:nucleotidyltransferase family protein [Vibrio parahaemolyticus]|nr:nucleotidyltransferase family protein [Vibrio parahaemolyticus]
MNELDEISQIIIADELILQAIHTVKKLGLNDWFISAGFIRNFIWDHHFGKRKHEVISDIDVIYFNDKLVEEEIDFDYEATLKSMSPRYNWSVKNQARMHIRNGDNAYKSSLDAMSYWPEIQTAIGVTLDSEGNVLVKSPFIEDYKVNCITRNKNKNNSNVFNERVKNRFWLSRWPELVIEP